VDDFVEHYNPMTIGEAIHMGVGSMVLGVLATIGVVFGY